MDLKKENFRTLERIVRGFSNHRRIQILTLLEKDPELSLIEISDILDINMKTGGAHLSRLAQAGLVLKRNDFRAVRHALSSRGKLILKFLSTLE